ncbi:hypothetical protein K438DRAFT_1984158 [Mycena galopus ATCC 62051]|nr:hypothetical protein K438DRAFT_1984158 [Mycena galopus ATCC 62051]
MRRPTERAIKTARTRRTRRATRHIPRRYQRIYVERSSLGMRTGYHTAPYLPPTNRKSRAAAVPTLSGHRANSCQESATWRDVCHSRPRHIYTHAALTVGRAWCALTCSEYALRSSAQIWPISRKTTLRRRRNEALQTAMPLFPFPTHRLRQPHSGPARQSGIVDASVRPISLRAPPLLHNTNQQ